MVFYDEFGSGVADLEPFGGPIDGEIADLNQLDEFFLFLDGGAITFREILVWGFFGSLSLSYYSSLWLLGIGLLGFRF